MDSVSIISIYFIETLKHPFSNASDKWYVRFMVLYVCMKNFLIIERIFWEWN